MGRLLLDVDLLETQGKWLLPFPGAAHKLNVEPNLFIKTLEEIGWLVIDVLSPMRKVQVINQVRGVLLASEPSGFMKQLITVSTLPVSRATSNQPLKPDNQAPTQDNKNKPLQNKTEKFGKGQKLKQKSSATKPDGLSPPKPQSEAEPAITNKPVKQKAIVAGVSKTSTAQHSVLSIPSGNLAVMGLINQLRNSRPVSDATKADNAWHSVEEPEMAQYLKDHPGLKRSALLREMASHPDFQMAEGGIKVRISP